MLNLFLYRVRLKALGSIRLDKFPGIALEGALTAGIHEVSCACRSDEAMAVCPVGRRCTYHLLARPAAEHFPSLPRRYGTPPPPLVLRPRFPAGTYAPGAELELQVVLVGSAQESFRWVLAGLAAAGRRGVGPARAGSRLDGRFEIRGVDVVGPRGESTLWDESRAAPAAHPSWRYPDDFAATPTRGFGGSFTVELRSPALIATREAPRGSLELADLVAAIGKRASLLGTAFAGENPVDFAEHARLQELASRVRIAARGCQWQEWSRHSRRQQRSFPVGGWTGWVRYQGEVTPFLPLLRLASLLHVGAHTLRGFGEVALREGP